MYNKYLKNKDFIIEIISDDENLIEVKRTYNIKKDNPNQICNEIYNELKLYFSKKSKNFSSKYLLKGTDFQVKVWKELIKIPYGKVTTYKEVAENINKPKAIRAVANAIGKNKFLIIVPCHRVIGTNGSLTGFSSGLDLKEYLLNLEKEKHGK